jgi:hypothetical protein
MDGSPYRLVYDQHVRRGIGQISRGGAAMAHPVADSILFASLVVDY